MAPLAYQWLSGGARTRSLRTVKVGDDGLGPAIARGFDANVNALTAVADLVRDAMADLPNPFNVDTAAGLAAREATCGLTETYPLFAGFSGRDVMDVLREAIAEWCAFVEAKGI